MIILSVQKIPAKPDRALRWQIDAKDASTQKAVTDGHGATPREAARELVRRANKLLSEIENQLVDMGFLTEAEIDQISDSVTEDLLREPDGAS